MDRRKEHSLHDVLMIAILGMLCGAETFVDFEDFGNAKKDWLEGFLELPNGIPSHDTFGRVFAAMDNKVFAESFRNWTEGLRKKISGEIVAIDGKALRRSHDKYRGKSAIHMVSAWGRENGLVLRQIKVDEKSNEITAIPQLLRTLELAECIVTIDAMGTQKEIAREIREADAKNFARAARGHWAVENSLHWSLDVCFAEDACRIRAGYASENMAILRHITLNVLKNDTSKKRGIKGKKKNAAWDHSYLLSLLRF
jgi:predicted transposase YbfD/YdcC